MQVETGLKRVKMNDKETYVYITENGTKKEKRIGSQEKGKLKQEMVKKISM